MILARNSVIVTENIKDERLEYYVSRSSSLPTEDGIGTPNQPYSLADGDYVYEQVHYYHTDGTETYGQWRLSYLFSNVTNVQNIVSQVVQKNSDGKWEIKDEVLKNTYVYEPLRDSNGGIVYDDNGNPVADPNKPIELSSIGSRFSQTEDRISLIVTGTNSESGIEITDSFIQAIANNGFVVRSNLTDGQTTISGNNITTGVIKSSEYSEGTSFGFSGNGLKIDLDNSSIVSPYFLINKDGAKFKGEINSSSGKIGGFDILEDKLTLSGEQQYINTELDEDFNIIGVDNILEEKGITISSKLWKSDNEDDINYMISMYYKKSSLDDKILPISKKCRISAEKIVMGEDKRFLADLDDESASLERFGSRLTKNSLTFLSLNTRANGFNISTLSADGLTVSNKQMLIGADVFYSSIQPGRIIENGVSLSEKYEENHNARYIIFNESTHASLTSGENLTVRPIRLPSAGVWLVEVHGSYASNNTGYRRMWVALSEDGDYTNRRGSTVAAVPNGVNTPVGTTFVYKVAEPTTLYLRTRQNSGSNLDFKSYLKLYKLGNFVDTETIEGTP